jgi:uncharacterized protein
VSADEAGRVIAALGLVPHPEGGHYRETFRNPLPQGGRAYSTAIYYLLRRGEASRWHRVDAAEIWHWYAGSPLRLSLSADGRALERRVLGNDLDAGERPQAAVPAGSWQRAESRGDWSLVGCTVAPAFEFGGFELAPEGWEPGRDGG